LQGVSESAWKPAEILGYQLQQCDMEGRFWRPSE
jgi:hypothetical protein